MEARTDYPELRWPGSVRGKSDKELIDPLLCMTILVLCRLKAYFVGTDNFKCVKRRLIRYWAEILLCTNAGPSIFVYDSYNHIL